MKKTKHSKKIGYCKKQKVVTGDRLQSLIKIKGLSQRKLAQAMGGFKQSAVVWLKQKSWEEYSLKEVELVAKAMKIRAADFILYLQGQIEDDLCLSVPKEPIHKIEFARGCEYVSLTPYAQNYDIGRVAIAPRKIILRHRTPRSKFIFFFVLSGEIEISIFDKPRAFKAGESFYLDGEASYDLSNLKNSRADLILFSLPSLLSNRPSGSDTEIGISK